MSKASDFKSQSSGLLNHIYINPQSVSTTTDNLPEGLNIPSHARSTYKDPDGPFVEVKADLSSSERKNSPVFSGVLQYFPDAMMEISRHSKKGNDKHNPGQPLHWAKEKSKDHADCIARHLIDIGPNWDLKDLETDSYHATALAWRALALLQILLERQKNDNNKE